ncbi:MAG TPA: hypothetical protein VFK36_12645 [Gemmatimonadales bacterium]|nr:hypothetical protein [Gemmatimonadales bacterium]
MGALAALTLLLGACSAETTAPATGGPPLDFPSGVSGGGQANTASAVVGTWRRFDVLSADDSADIITQTTEWAFDSTGACERTITTFDAVEGFPRASQRDCTWDTSVQEITLHWSDGEVNTFSLTFAGFDPDRMVLDGFEYQRIS